MKTKSIILGLIFSISLLSCKQEEKKVEVVEKEVETFNVTLNAVVKQNDVFQLFYVEEKGNGFDELKSLKVDVIGSNEAQNIVFKFPEDVLPANIRLDLGENNMQKEIKFNTLTFKYFDKNFVITPNKIEQYFVPGQLTFDAKTGQIKIDQGKEEKYDPLLYPQSGIEDELEKLIK